MFAELNRKLKMKIFSLIAVVLVINFTLIFCSYSYIMKNDYNQKVIHICEKSTEYISLKLKSIEDTAITFSKDNNLKSAIYTYTPYVLKTIAELKTVNEDIGSAFVVSDRQSYFYDSSDKSKFMDLLDTENKEFKSFGEGQWVIFDNELLYICKICNNSGVIGLLGFKVQEDLFYPIFEDYSNHFLRDVAAIIFNDEETYTIFGDNGDNRFEQRLHAEDNMAITDGGNICYKASYDKNLGIMITTSEKQIDSILLKLAVILLVIFLFACVLLYLLLNKYLNFVTGKLEKLRLRIQKFSDELDKGGKIND